MVTTGNHPIAPEARMYFLHNKYRHNNGIVRKYYIIVGFL